METQSKRNRAILVVVAALALVISGAITAHAWHGACNGGVTTGNVTPVGPYYNSAGVLVSTSTSSVAVCYDVTDAPAGACATNCGGEVVTIADPNTSSVGKAVSLGGGNSITGATTVGNTGAEAGTPCTGGGVCVGGSTVYVAGSIFHLDNKTGVQGFGSPTLAQSATPLTCVSSTCVYGEKVSAGRADVYVNSLTPVASVPLCVSVGPGVSCP